MDLKSAGIEETVIGQVMSRFVAGDPTMFELVAEDIDFRIDHFRDDADTSWQRAESREDLIMLVGRLGSEVFPKGTSMQSLQSAGLGNGWYLTEFRQQFFYGLTQKDVSSVTYILSHEVDGRLDYFRETVSTLEDA